MLGRNTSEKPQTRHLCSGETHKETADDGGVRQKVRPPYDATFKSVRKRFKSLDEGIRIKISEDAFEEFIMSAFDRYIENLQ